MKERIEKRLGLKLMNVTAKLTIFPGLFVPKGRFLVVPIFSAVCCLGETDWCRQTNRSTSDCYVYRSHFAAKNPQEIELRLTAKSYNIPVLLSSSATLPLDAV